VYTQVFSFTTQVLSFTTQVFSFTTQVFSFTTQVLSFTTQVLLFTTQVFSRTYALRSPNPLKKGGKNFSKSPNLSGDLGGSRTILVLFQRCVYTVALVRGGERLLYSNAEWGSLFLIYARGLMKQLSFLRGVGGIKSLLSHSKRLVCTP
jgi:hypothetical protein